MIYLNDQLKTIVHNGFHISFTNNGFQQLTSIDLLHPTNPLLKRNLMSRSYDPITQRLLSQTYGNGHTVSYDVDDQNRVIAIRHQGVVKTTFDYDANGLLGRLVEVDRGVTIRYIYDFANRLVSMVSSEGVSTRYHYDANNQVSSITDSVGSSNRTTSYTFDDDNRLTQLTTPANRIRSYTLDGLGRLTSSTINTTTPLLSSYTYQPHPSDPTLTSARLASVTHGSLPSIHYTYDANGNIVSVQQGSATIQYIYNELNEVIRENNQRDQVTWVYEYDLGGNIVAKKEYPYTTGSLSTPLRVIPYVYGDAVWKDLLTSYDGQAISSDTIGNPLIMGNRTFTWQKGRQLAALNIGGTNVQYSYNHAGIRTSKLVNGVTTTYRLRGDVVLEETTGSSTIRYGYDPNNQLISIEYGGVEYGVLRNAQNDVMALVNPSGSIVVQYAYSTWGEVVSISGSMASTLGAANPYRYRGYRFDTESGYYYIQSRYYDPNVGRWLSAEPNVDFGGFDDGAGLLSYNVYAYCANNPVNFYDPDGESMVLTVYTVAAVGSNFWNPIGLVLLGVVAVGIGIWAYNNHKANQTAALASALALMNYASIAASPPPPNKGGKGTQTSSKTLYNKSGKNGFRIDVENPGNRIGQIHMQKGGIKYYYNVLEKSFRIGSSNGQLAPKAIQQLLQNSDVIKAIGKGLTILGY